jgi:hypothetical protein
MNTCCAEIVNDPGAASAFEDPDGADGELDPHAIDSSATHNATNRFIS